MFVTSYLFVFYKYKPCYLVLRTRSNAMLKIATRWTEESNLLPKSVEKK